ncbi:MAG: hypothetical protein CMO80_23450 [Verrucomicrobiales bacterium]|nr:hypothetical protein [Verrucomicrobiales bacterium]|tara:strand:- start:321 stop:635 length:315 start_codon:yes stop_codon:yes gene_type:complete
MTVDKYRELALSFPGTEEMEHMNHPDFRVGGKIFATLWPDDRKGTVMILPEQQAEFCQSHPKIFTPVKGGWGKQGATEVHLPAATIKVTREALRYAWEKHSANR